MKTRTTALLLGGVVGLFAAPTLVRVVAPDYYAAALIVSLLLLLVGMIAGLGMWIARGGAR